MVKKSVVERLDDIDKEIDSLELKRKDYVNAQNEGNKKRVLFDWLSGAGVLTALCGFFLLFINLIAGLCVLGAGAISGYAFSAFSGKHKKIAKDEQFNIQTCNAKIEELKKDRNALIKEQDKALGNYKEYDFFGRLPLIPNTKNEEKNQKQNKDDNELSM